MSCLACFIVRLYSIKWVCITIRKPEMLSIVSALCRALPPAWGGVLELDDKGMLQIKLSCGDR